MFTMSKTTVIQPTKEIIDSCNLIEHEIDKVISSFDELKLGYYEHQVEGRTLIILAIRHFHSLITLAKADLSLLHSANVLCRAIFESCTHCLWMTHPKDPFEGECRWVSRLIAEENFHGRLASHSNHHPHLSPFSETEKEIAGFRKKVEASLVQKGYKIEKLPDLRNMLKFIDADHMYVHYMFFSQFSHSTRISLSTYVRGYGTEKETGEKIKPSDWKYIFRIGWNSFSYCVSSFLKKTAKEGETFEKLEIEKIARMIEKIK